MVFESAEGNREAFQRLPLQIIVELPDRTIGAGCTRNHHYPATEYTVCAQSR